MTEPIPGPTPGPVRAARVLASLQVLLAAGGVGFGLVVAVGGASRDAGGFGDLATAAGLAIAGFGLVPLLALGAPLVLLRPGRDAARVALVLGEAVVALLSVVAFAFAVLYALPLIASCVGVAVLLVQPAARAWSGAAPVS